MCYMWAMYQKKLKPIFRIQSVDEGNFVVFSLYFHLLIQRQKRVIPYTETLNLLGKISFSSLGRIKINVKLISNSLIYTLRSVDQYKDATLPVNFYWFPLYKKVLGLE